MQYSAVSIDFHSQRPSPCISTITMAKGQVTGRIKKGSEFEFGITFSFFVDSYKIKQRENIVVVCKNGESANDKTLEKQFF